MAKKSAAQRARAAETTQKVSGQVRVDAKVQIGKRQWRRLSEIHPTLKSASDALDAGGFQVGTVTSPSGVQVQVSRGKGGVSAGQGHQVRAPEFGDQNYPSPRSNVAGARPGEARWRVHNPRGESVAQGLLTQADAVASAPNPVASHPTIGRLKSLIGVPANEAEEHANRLEARMSRSEAMDLDNDPEHRAAARTMVRAAGTLAQRQRDERVGAQQAVAKAATRAAQRDPKLYGDVVAQSERQTRAQRLRQRAGNMRRDPSESQQWAGVPRSGTPGESSTPVNSSASNAGRVGLAHTGSVAAGSTVQNARRAREMQGYVYTQQAGENLTQNPDYREAQAWVRETGGRGPAAEAGKRVTSNMRAANRAAIRQNKVPMNTTVGRAPTDVVEAKPMTERTNNAAPALPQARGSSVRNSNPPASANTPKIAPAKQTVTRPPQRPTGGGSTESALANARAEVAKRAGK